MPIKIQSDLPAREILDNENIFVMDEYRAMHQNIRPLQICILNLMPVKQDTELQLLRSLSNTPLQVDVTFMKMNSHLSLNTSATHLNKFYDTFDDLKSNKYDGLIITGAPVEQIPFEEVDLLERTLRNYGVVKDPRPFHVPHLLGRPSRSVLPLRTRQTPVAGKAFRGI